ncbi:hypothetical protein Maq22A_c28425 [Methylobacterium aquaticum]|nr:hypothetical protein Maq22A_c28425 [Methylobacterium aquaticum]
MPPLWRGTPSPLESLRDREDLRCRGRSARPGSMRRRPSSPRRPTGIPHVRSFDAGGRPGLLRPVARLRLLVRTPVRRPVMTLDYGLGGLMTLGLLAYLAYALVRPERF